MYRNSSGNAEQNATSPGALLAHRDKRARVDVVLSMLIRPRGYIVRALLIPILVISFTVTAHAAIINDNCLSDQTVQLQDAIDARTGNVTLPVGCIAISKPIYAQTWVALQGAGKRLTVLKALPTFRGEALVIIGTNLDSDIALGRSLVFDSMVSDMTLDATAAPAGTSCAHLAGAQEGSGLQRNACVGVSGATSDAIVITDNVNRVAFRDIEIYPATAIRYGISNSNAFCGCEINNVTVGVTFPMEAGIRVLDGVFTALRIHCVYAANCIQVDGNNSVGVITGVDGPTVLSTTGNLLFVRAASKVVAQGLVRNGYTRSVQSLFGAGVDRADPYIAQILINN